MIQKALKMLLPSDKYARLVQESQSSTILHRPADIDASFDESSHKIHMNKVTDSSKDQQTFSCQISRNLEDIQSRMASAEGSITADDVSNQLQPIVS